MGKILTFGEIMLRLMSEDGHIAFYNQTNLRLLLAAVKQM